MHFALQSPMRKVRGKTLLLFVAFMALASLPMESLAQNIEFSTQYRRAYDQLYVEVYARSLTTEANTPRLGSMTLAFTYDATGLVYVSTATATQLTTDSINSDVDVANPVVSISSDFSAANSYAQSASAIDNYAFLSFTYTGTANDAVRPSSSGMGTFVGKLIFNIKSGISTTDTAGVYWSRINSPSINRTQVFQAGNTTPITDGWNDSTNVRVRDPQTAFSVFGVTILEPNGNATGTAILDRDLNYASLTASGASVTGFPIYFERTIIPSAANNYGRAVDTTLSYNFGLSLDNGTTFESANDIGRISESGSSATSANISSGAQFSNSVETDIIITTSSSASVLTQANITVSTSDASAGLSEYPATEGNILVPPAGTSFLVTTAQISAGPHALGLAVTGADVSTQIRVSSTASVPEEIFSGGGELSSTWGAIELQFLVRSTIGSVLVLNDTTTSKASQTFAWDATNMTSPQIDSLNPVITYGTPELQTINGSSVLVSTVATTRVTFATLVTTASEFVLAPRSTSANSTAAGVLIDNGKFGFGIGGTAAQITFGRFPFDGINGSDLSYTEVVASTLAHVDSYIESFTTAQVSNGPNGVNATSQTSVFSEAGIGLTFSTAGSSSSQLIVTSSTHILTINNVQISNIVTDTVAYTLVQLDSINNAASQALTTPYTTTGTVISYTTAYHVVTRAQIAASINDEVGEVITTRATTFVDYSVTFQRAAEQTVTSAGLTSGPQITFQPSGTESRSVIATRGSVARGDGFGGIMEVTAASVLTTVSGTETLIPAYVSSNANNRLLVGMLGLRKVHSLQDVGLSFAATTISTNGDATATVATITVGTITLSVGSTSITSIAEATDASGAAMTHTFTVSSNGNVNGSSFSALTYTMTTTGSSTTDGTSVFVTRATLTITIASVSTGADVSVYGGAAAGSTTFGGTNTVASVTIASLVVQYSVLAEMIETPVYPDLVSVTSLTRVEVTTANRKLFPSIRVTSSSLTVLDTYFTATGSVTTQATITTFDGNALPIFPASGSEGSIGSAPTLGDILNNNDSLFNRIQTEIRKPLRVVWAADETSSLTADEARLRIQLLNGGITGSPYSSMESGKKRSNVTLASSGGSSDSSDGAFRLGAKFFTQLNGSDQYLKTDNPLNGGNQLTVMAWVNLNRLKSGQEVGVVASSLGTDAVNNEEGAWMLYLKDGNTPAFRVREVDGGTGRGIDLSGNDGGLYLAVVEAPNALSVVSDANTNTTWRDNWTHIAATVRDNIVRLYVDGQLVSTYTNTNQFGKVRMLAAQQNMWVGINPNGSSTLDTNKTLHAGVRGVQIWNAPLTQRQIQERIAGIPIPQNTGDSLLPGHANSIQVNENGFSNSALQIYSTLEGTLRDYANNLQQQGGRTDFSILSALNSTTSGNYRPDQPMIKLTSPIGGEGVRNRTALDTFTVSWVSYGLAGLSTTASVTNAIAIEYSLGGDDNKWTTAAGQTVSGTDVQLTDIGASFTSSSISWIPFNNRAGSAVHPSTAVDSSGTVANGTAESLVDFGGAYSTTNVRLRVRGANGNQRSVSDVSGVFSVAPNFALDANTNGLTVVDTSRRFVMANSNFMMEAWVRPYRFPTSSEEYFPVIAKSSNNQEYFALDIMANGTLRLRLRDSLGTLRSMMTPNVRGRRLEEPATRYADTAWSHVAVYVDGLNGTGNATARFYIDGNVIVRDSSFGSAIDMSSVNAQPLYLAQEVRDPTTATKKFVGQIRDVRFWNATPQVNNVTLQTTGDSDPNTSVVASKTTSELTRFIQGALAVKGKELLSTHTGNLVAAFALDGGDYIHDPNIADDDIFNRSTRTRTIESNTPAIYAEYSASSSVSFDPTAPYLKLAEPMEDQGVPQTTEDMRVRWAGFDFQAEGGMQNSGSTTTASIDVSVGAGAGDTVRTYLRLDAGSAGRFFTFPTTDEFQFAGSGTTIQFGAQLNVTKAWEDSAAIPSNNFNTRLRWTNESDAFYRDNSSTDSIVAQGPIFSILPPSNFTVRVLLEGYHNGRNGAVEFTNPSSQLSTAYNENGIRIALFENTATNVPGDPVNSTKVYTGTGYGSLDPSNRDAGTKNFGNYEFYIDDIADSEYFVLVQQQNYLPVLTRYAARYRFNGLDTSTAGIESGWDFTTWGGNPVDFAQVTATLPSSEAGATTGTWLSNGYYTAWGLQVTDGNADRPGFAETALLLSSGRTNTPDIVNSISALPSMVAGDIDQDGDIDAQDFILTDAAANTASRKGDVDGSGFVNGADRAIVKRNQESSKRLNVNDQPFRVHNLVNTANGTGNTLPSLIKIDDNNDGSEGIQGNSGKTVPTYNAPLKKYGAATIQGASYLVTGEAKLAQGNDYVDVEMFIENQGAAFNLGNATFAVQYDPTRLEFDDHFNNGVIFSANTEAGYQPSVFSPAEGASNTFEGVHGIEVIFSFNTQFPNANGVTVPNAKTYLGTLRFKIRKENAVPGDILNFSWFKTTVVLTTAGEDVTGDLVTDGKFAPIDPLVLPVDTYGEIIRPNGGEQILAGSVTRIAYTHRGLDRIDFELSVDGGLTWLADPVLSVDAGAEEQELDFSWKTLASQASKQCVLRMRNAVSGEILDETDTWFELVADAYVITKPSVGDAIYEAGSNSTIEWQINNSEVTVGDVFFEFSPDNGTSWAQISGEVSIETLSVAWTIPENVNTCDGLVRMMTNEGAETIELTRSDRFKVAVGTIDLVFQDGTDYEANEDVTIRWNTLGVQDGMDLWFSKDNGSTWDFITNIDPATLQTRQYKWQMPELATKTEQAIIAATYPGKECLEFDRTGMFILDGASSVTEGFDVDGFNVGQPVPNPANSSTVVSFTLPQQEVVTVTLFNSLGKVESVLKTSEVVSAGTHSVNVNVEGLAAGVYYMQFVAGDYKVTRQVLVVE